MRERLVNFKNFLRTRLKPRYFIELVLYLVPAMYLSGLFTQVLGKFLKVGVCAELEEVSMGFTRCLRWFFTGTGLVIFLILSVATIIISYGLYYQSGHKKGTWDKRGFKILKSGTYGTAHHLTEREMELGKMLSFEPVGPMKGVPLGLVDGKKDKLLCIHPHTQLPNKNYMIFGGPGSGKSTAIGRPAIYSAINRGESIIVTDPKTELYKDTAYLLNENGYEIKVFNLNHPEWSDSWDALSDITNNLQEAQGLIASIIRNTAGPGASKPFEDGQQNLLSALLFYVIESDEYEGRRNLPEVLDLLLEEEKLETMFATLKDRHPDAKALKFWQAYGLSKKNERLSASFASGLATRLQFLQSEPVKRMLSKSNHELELIGPGKRKCAYFIVKNTENILMEPLSALFFTTMFSRLKDYASQCEGLHLPVYTNFIFDEFCNIGKLGSSDDGKDFGAFVSTARSYGISLMMICQSVVQLDNRYPFKVSKEISENCSVKMFLGAGKETRSTEEYFSDLCGTCTIEVVSSSIGKRTYGEGKRNLYNPDELQCMDSRKDILVLVQGKNPIMLTKKMFWEYPQYKYVNEHPMDATKHIENEDTVFTHNSYGKYYTPPENNSDKDPYSVNHERILDGKVTPEKSVEDQIWKDNKDVFKDSYKDTYKDDYKDSYNDGLDESIDVLNLAIEGYSLKKHHILTLRDLVNTPESVFYTEGILDNGGVSRVKSALSKKGLKLNG